MGETADMMLEGDLCEACGAALSGEGYGIPRYCSNECARDRGYDGIQSDGAGTYFKKKKVKQVAQNNLVIKMSHDGKALFKDRKHLKYQETDFEKAKQFAEEVRILADKYFKEN
jgi:hypothetical protein